MKQISKKTYILFFGIVCAVCIAGVYMYTHPTQEEESTLRVSGREFSTLRDYWKTQIQAIGPAGAYKAFLVEAWQNTEMDPHAQAHVFGEALYETENIEGIKYCDSSFEFGCYHSFFGSAVYNEGIEVLPLFDQACKDAYGKENLPCQHGIGHGLLIYTGYENLVEALSLCETISWQPTGGCSSGIFMEYNFHTMESVEGENYLRPLEGNPFQPCDQLPVKHQPSCYLEQVQWWENIYARDYEKIGSLCTELPGTLQENQSACFYGVGNYVAAYHRHEVPSIIQTCELMPDTGTQAQCHEGASWLVRSGEYGIDGAVQLCEALSDKYKDACLQKLGF